MPSISPHPVLMWLVCSFWMNPEVMYDRQESLKSEKKNTKWAAVCLLITTWLYLQFLIYSSSTFYSLPIVNIAGPTVPPASFQRWLGNLTVLIPTKCFFISQEHLGWPLLYAIWSKLLLTSEKFGYSVLYSWLSEKGKLYPLPVSQSP